MVKVGTQKPIRDEVANDGQAFAALVEQYQALVFALVMRFVSNREDAEDVAQEVFLQVFRSLPQCQPDHLKAWIGRVAVNKAIDWKRKQARSPETIPVQVEDLAGRDTESPEYSFIQLETEAHIRKLCSSLAPHYRRVLIKYHFEDKSYRQIAREEGISISTVESRLYRARKLLRRKWEEGRE